MRIRNKHLLIIGQAMVVGLSLVCVLAIVASCNDNKIAEGGRTMGERVNQRTTAANFEYVGDASTQEYWPNKSKYANKISEDYRVYIKDTEALKLFKGWHPGPL